MFVRRVVVGLAGGAVLLAAGCSGEKAKSALSASDEAKVVITPADRPDRPVVVTAGGGTLESVTVKGAGKDVAGAFDQKRARWTTSRALRPATAYTVTATAKNSDGRISTATSSFRTLKPKRTFGVADITPMPGETVGVGMPIIVKFDRAVGDKAAVAKALKVTSEKPVEGAWRWVADDQAVYRTKAYWQPHQKVTLDAELAGVRGGKDTYGTKDHHRTMKIGSAQVSRIDVRKHRMAVKRDGRTLRSFGISAGNGSTREFTTTSGVHLAMGKEGSVTMVSPGRKKGDPGYYETHVDQAVRISNSGEYYHSAPWSVGDQGRRNVSHGCVNIAPGNAKWLYGITQRGDVVDITGTDRELEPDNGWGFWQLSWSQWKA